MNELYEFTWSDISAHTYGKCSAPPPPQKEHVLSQVPVHVSQILLKVPFIHYSSSLP